MPSTQRSGPGRGRKSSLDNKETVGDLNKRVKLLSCELHGRAISNKKRLKLVSDAVRVNKEMAKELDVWLPWFQHQLTPDQLAHMTKLRNRLGACCQYTLLREFQDKELEYIGSHTCNHKACNVCNKLRCKAVRRKYNRYFKARPELTETHDFMHAMLTVPHNAAGGFRGEHFYLRAITDLFREMRKHKVWKELVWAGEYGVEITRNQEGLHIHIHALLLLPKADKSRNTLYKWMLQYWNRVTVDNQAKRSHFEPAELEAIAAGLKPKNATADQAAEAAAIAGSLNPRGSTIVHLESLYVKRKDGSKRYVNSTNLEDLMKGVMECIKYHFEPLAMLKKGEGYDFRLLAEILPLMHKQPMYRKFGAWHKETALNLKDSATPEHQVGDILAETGHSEIVHPTTAEVIDPEQVQYFITNAAGIFVQPDSWYAFTSKKSNKSYLPRGISTRTACEIMLATSVPKRKHKTDPEDI